MDTLAVVLEKPGKLALSRLPLCSAGEDDVVVDIHWSGISTGTEKLLWSGRMPHFPGMGYPLVPGYESVGVVREAGPSSRRREGERVFVPGARCFGDVRGLFGGAASRVVVPGDRVIPVDDELAEDAVLLALAATAYHAIARTRVPELIVGHGVLGRLLARLALMLGDRPVTVWETNPVRAEGASGYTVLDPDDDARRDYGCICDVSGDASLLDELVARLTPRGEIVLAGFYDEPLSFDFPPAFMREASIRIAAEWQPADMTAVCELVRSGGLSLHGLITHRHPADEAPDAYTTAFGDPACLKMILDWSSCS